ncbi:TVP38/TMEM64 family protein [Robiginitomaculum antarcticum]|uniref:TVP38/TMEM64 family protein n=1 Tax=Robiginitomaculum antarcticum TaxID=437507 RepID=UPI000370F07D|nr:VTT domain-containing protein [Robiginitomaculum antarcticum]
MSNSPENRLRPTLLLIGGAIAVVALFMVARHVFGITESDVNTLLSGLSDSPWAVLILILVFVLAAFIGVPQWALIGASVIAFGPVMGAAYSWLATMISAAVDFWAGRLLGEKHLARLRRPWVERFVARLRKSGFWVSFGVRLVPSGPFVLVNMAAGMSGMKFIHYLGGTALGIMPKILAIAFLGESLIAALSGDPWRIALAMIGFIIVIGIGYVLARSRAAKRANILPVEPL